MNEIPYCEIPKRLNIPKGVALLVSSDITRLAYQCIKNGEKFQPGAFIDALWEAVGPEGTLLFPTYNWGFCSGQPFHYHKTPCATGTLGKYALKRGDFIRTRHPIYSFAVKGKDQEMLYRMNNISSFGADSPFAYLHHQGYNLIIGVDLKGCFTFVHYVEEQVGDLPYRYLKTFAGTYIDENEKAEQRAYAMFVRDLDKDVVNTINPIEDDFLAEGASSYCRINGVDIRLVHLKKAYGIIENDIKNNHSKKLCYYKGQNAN